MWAPAIYIFFASLIPALAFGAQLDSETDGKYNGVHVLLATAIAGVTQAVIGGQPLLILGVAQPYILCTIYMYRFAKTQGFVDAFVPWCTWTTIWIAMFLMLLSLTGAFHAAISYGLFTSPPDACHLARCARASASALCCRHARERCDCAHAL